MSLDPVSNALSLAKTVGEVSWKLYIFSRDVRNNNQAIGDLSAELLFLYKAVASINSTLAGPTFAASEQRSTGDSSELWSLVHGNLSDTCHTLKTFEAVIWPLLPENDNVAKAAIRTAKLGLRQPEIASYRSRIQGHVNILSITLQTLNLRATYLAPGAILDKVLPAIAELRTLIERRDTGVTLPPEMLDRVKMVRAVARKEMSSATSVTTASEANASVMGDPMPDRQRAQTLDWIPEPELLHHIPPDPPEGTLTPRSTFQDPQIWSPAATATDPNAATLTNPTSGSVISAIDEEEDPDEDLQADLVQICFRRGKKLFEEKRFIDAQSYLQKGVEHAEKLPMKRRDFADLKKIQMMLAQCACHSPNLNEAERRLMKITQEVSPDSGDDDAVRRCQAMHLLSAVLFRGNNLPAAKSYCRKAITGRRKVLGKTDNSHYESVYLMAQICEAEDTEDGRMSAELYLDMIPEDVRPNLIKVIDEYSSVPTTRNASALGAPIQTPSTPYAEAGQVEKTAMLPPPSIPTPSSPPTQRLANLGFANLGEPALTGHTLYKSGSAEPQHSPTNMGDVSPRTRPIDEQERAPRLTLSADPPRSLSPPSPYLHASTPDFVSGADVRLGSRHSPSSGPSGDVSKPLTRPATISRNDSTDAPSPSPRSDAKPFDPDKITQMSPRIAYPAARTPSIVSSNSSITSTDAEEKRSRFPWFRRRSSKNNPPAPVALDNDSRPPHERSNSAPIVATQSQSLSPQIIATRPGSISAGMPDSRYPRQSLQEFLLDRITEETGQPRDVSYPGLF